MAKLTKESRSSLQSARAKNRKAMTALIAGEITVPKTIIAHMQAVEDWANKLLAPKAKAKPAKAVPVLETSETYDAEPDAVAA